MIEDLNISASMLCEFQVCPFFCQVICGSPGKLVSVGIMAIPVIGLEPLFSMVGDRLLLFLYGEERGRLLIALRWQFHLGRDLHPLGRETFRSAPVVQQYRAWRRTIDVWRQDWTLIVEDDRYSRGFEDHGPWDEMQIRRRHLYNERFWL